MEQIYYSRKRKEFSPHGYRYFFMIAIAVLAGLIPQSVTANISISPTESVQVVTGKVTDDFGAALPGANVLEKGTANGTVTDVEGNYSLTVASSESILVFSFVGTITQEIKVGSQSEINIQLALDSEMLSELVVVGYGTYEKKDITGAVASVKSEDFNKGIITSPEQLLQGKVAGVNVTSASGEPGSQQRISIRGQGSIRSGTTPLVVVDGMVLDNSSTGGATNPLSFLNPDDIETMDVLKDASATAIYMEHGVLTVLLLSQRKKEKQEMRA